MLRKDIEILMKQNKQTQIDLIYNESDKLGVFCYLSSGFLVDCWGKRVNRKLDIWGYLKWQNGCATRVPFRKD